MTPENIGAPPAPVPHDEDVIIWRLYPSGHYAVAGAHVPDCLFSQYEWTEALACAKERAAGGRRLWFCDQHEVLIPRLLS